MRREMDCIQFESRWEIGVIIQALEEWQKDHGSKNPERNEHVQELVDQLDVMSMNW